MYERPFLEQKYKEKTLISLEFEGQGSGQSTCH